MWSREELAAQIMCAYVASNTAAEFDKCFLLADRFLAYAAKQREPEDAECEHKRMSSWSQVPPLTLLCQDCGAVIPAPVTECQHEWRQPPYMSDYICHKCGAPKVKPEPPKPACEHNFVSKIGEFEREWEHCLKCGERSRREPPKPERVTKEWNIYRFDDGTYRAFSIGDSTISYVGGRPPTFVHRVREVLE